MSSAIMRTVSVQETKRLTCCCCGASTIGRQWWNRDTGFGLCDKCAEWIVEKYNYSPEDMKSCYGVKGVHYGLKESEVQL